MRSIARGFYRKFLETDEDKLIRKEKELLEQYRKIHKKDFTSVMVELLKYNDLLTTVRTSLFGLNQITKHQEFYQDKIVAYPRDNTRRSSS